VRFGAGQGLRSANTKNRDDRLTAAWLPTLHQKKAKDGAPGTLCLSRIKGRLPALEPVDYSTRFNPVDLQLKAMFQAFDCPRRAVGYPE
jgi:hypothetical protein